MGIGLLWEDVPAQRRLARVILDLLESLPVVPLQLPWPTDPRGTRAAELMTRDRAHRLPLASVAVEVGASRRTLERIIQRETAMTLGRWRQRARLIESLRMLAAGASVSRVALEVGYQSASAFVAAFHRDLGTTPGQYFDRP